MVVDTAAHPLPARPPLPPGPRAPMAVQTILAWSPRGDDWAHRLHRHYGDAFTVRIFPAGTMVFLANPEAIRQVFTGDPNILHAGEGNDVLRPVLGARSVLLIDGEPHLERRKLMLPMFHGDAIKQYASIVTSETEREVASWPLGAPFKLHPRFRALTFEVILRAVVGLGDERQLERFRATLPALVEIGELEMMMWAWPGLSRFGPWRRYAKRQAEADALLQSEIRARRAEPDGERRDILSMLAQARDERGELLDEDDVRDQLVTLLLAGHETTSTALAWAVECLLRNPDVMRRAQTAADTGDDAYLDAVVKETLRLRPVIQTIARKLTAPARVAGYDLPAGIVLAPSIGLVHHDPRQYPQPEQFRPERFLDADAPPYAWIPFGGGTRRCLGAAFAGLELRLALQSILQRSVLRPVRPRPAWPRVRNITSVPSDGVPVICTGR